MKNELLFGTAYYPEYMPYERIEKDLDMMKQIGMNVVRIAESTWSTIESQEGIFDFSYIEKVLKHADERNMKVIVGTPTYAIPSWLQKKDPNVMVLTREGRKKYGHRQLMDLLNPTFRFHAERVICKLAEYTAGHPAVIGFQIDNETKHYGNISGKIQELFKQYLISKFTTTDQLNQAFHLAYWSNSIQEWSDLPDISGCVNGGLAAEFEAFQRSLVAEFLNWQIDIVKQYKNEKQFIMHNLDFEWKKFGADIAQDGYSYGIQPDVEHNLAARELTIVGADIYHPTQDELTGAEIAFCGDEIRCLKDENYLVAECQAQAFKNWTPYPGQLRLHAYSHLASGALGIMYWHWHSIHNGYETYWRGLLSHDLQTNPVYEEAGLLGEEWGRLKREQLCIKKKNTVALVIDNRTLTAFNWFPIDRDLSYNDVVRWMYDSLYEINIECDVVHMQDLQPDRYQVIITPALYCVNEKLIEGLKQFVRSGGTLISSFRSFVADQYSTVYPDIQPHNLTDCFGMSYNQMTEPGRTRINGEAVRYYAELLKPTTAEVIENYEHPYWGKYAGITKNTYGKGKAYYIGCYISKTCLKKVYQEAVEENRCVGEWPIIIKNGLNDCGKEIHYVLHYSESNREWKCPYQQVKDILTNIVYHFGDTILLKDWSVHILEEVK